MEKKKMIIIAVAVVAIAAVGYVAVKGRHSATTGDKNTSQTEKANKTDKSGKSGKSEKAGKNSGSEAKSSVKEFAMNSYYDETGKWFSLKEIDVKKGDTVRIKVTNTKGMHDFTIDEYDIKQETPEGQETTIEFTADKAGEFVYYCSKPGHRAAGQWGTLKVTE